MAETVSINLNSLFGTIDDAAYAAARSCWRGVDTQFDRAINEKIWPWPRDMPTKKLTGATLAEKLRNYLDGKGASGGNPRAINDMGTLSQSKLFTSQGLTAEWRWTVDYASYVQHGAMIRPWGAKNRRVFLPPRDWERAVLGDGQGPTVDLRYDLRERFQTFLRIEIKRRRG
jgi:hypothetical protein